MSSPAVTGRVVAVLLIAGAATFAVGAAVEHSDHHDNPAAETAHPTEPAGQDEASESAGQDAATAASPSAQASRRESSENAKVLGLDIESAGWVVVGVATSLTLAAFAWRWPRRTTFLATAVFAGMFALLDAAEVMHLAERSRSGLQVLAVLTALVHLSASAISVIALASPRSQLPDTPETAAANEKSAATERPDSLSGAQFRAVTLRY